MIFKIKKLFDYFIYWVGILIALTIVPSCESINSDNNDIKNQERISIDYEVLHNDTVRCKLQNIDFDNNVDEYSGIELIIDNETDYNEHVSCVCYTCNDTIKPNFENVFVLAGMSTVQGNIPYVYDQSLYLESDTLKYKVTIKEGAATIPGRAMYIVSVSKEYFKYPVDFIVTEEP